MKVDLNLDAGEEEAKLASGEEAKLYRLVTRVNIACGGHAGDASTMREAVRLAADAGVIIGAHPSFPDRANFGRLVMTLPLAEVTSFVRAQVSALRIFCADAGQRLSHVKAHGALYNAMANDLDLARAFADGVTQTDASLTLVGLAGSTSIDYWRGLGFKVLGEAFADRRYQSNGTLVPRGSPGAVITEPSAAAVQARELVRHGRVRTITGEVIAMPCETLCVHGDNPAVEQILLEIGKS